MQSPAPAAMTLVVAADGGNSKTDLVVLTHEGGVLARVQGPGTTPILNGMAATAQSLADLVRRAVKAAGLPPETPIEVGAFYLANVDQPEEELDMLARLVDHGFANEVHVRNDVFAVLRSGSTRDWGVAVVSGAGINAVGVHPDGHEERFLALGDITGDWGGGAAVAVAGLGAAIRAGDGRGPATTLRSRIAEMFGSEAEAVAIAVNRGEIVAQRLHGLSPVVFDAASDGDPVARAIVERLADETVCFAATLLRRLDLLTSDADVVLGGGTLQSGNQILLQRIESALRTTAPNVAVRVLDVPPVTGAVVDALTRVGASREAVRRARATLARLG